MNIDLSKLIPQPNLQNLSCASELLAQVSTQPLKENSTVLHAVSVPTVCQMCPLRGNRPNCNQCNRFL
nr:MAG TPA: hypothetical protein [Caudoviricetes sp.]